MKDQNENQAIEEMARVIEVTEQIARDAHCGYPSPTMYAKDLYWHGYRKQSEGEWILTGTFKSTFPLPVAYFHEACSVCRWIPPKYSADYKKYNFCPNCGAHMKGGAE